MANEFIKLSMEKRGEGLYLLPLIKLSYIAHGFTLAITEKPLCYETVEVWQYGPVFPSIFHTFKHIKMILRDKPAILHNNDYPFTQTESKIINITYDKYSHLNSDTLSVITHGEGTPWQKAYDKGLGIIDNETIKNHYKQII